MGIPRIKKTIIIFLISSGVLVYFYLSYKTDYAWHIKQIQELEDNWYLYRTIHTNTISFIKPWRIFKSPVDRLAFIEKGSLKEIEPNIFHVKELWIDRDIDTLDIRGETFEFLINCNNYETGWLENNHIEWKEPKSEEGIKMYQELCLFIKEKNS
jgi:hypothetical protein